MPAQLSAPLVPVKARAELDLSMTFDYELPAELSTAKRWRASGVKSVERVRREIIGTTGETARGFPQISENTPQGTGTHRTSGRQAQRFKRIALRCEKTTQNYGSFVALALGFILIKSVARRMRSGPMSRSVSKRSASSNASSVSHFDARRRRRITARAAETRRSGALDGRNGGRVDLACTRFG